MSRDQSLNNIFTIAVTLRCGELPSNFLTDWDQPIADDEIATCYVSTNGRIMKKCIFIESQELALKLVDLLKHKMLKSKPSIQFTVRKVKPAELDYRRKTARLEAQENDKVILDLTNK